MCWRSASLGLPAWQSPELLSPCTRRCALFHNHNTNTMSAGTHCQYILTVLSAIISLMGGHAVAHLHVWDYCTVSAAFCAEFQHSSL